MRDGCHMPCSSRYQTSCPLAKVGMGAWVGAASRGAAPGVVGARAAAAGGRAVEAGVSEGDFTPALGTEGRSGIPPRPEGRGGAVTSVGPVDGVATDGLAGFGSAGFAFASLSDGNGLHSGGTHGGEDRARESWPASCWERRCAVSCVSSS